MLQLSIFLENSKGRLAEVLNLLTEMQVNLKALSLTDTKDFGVLRVIIDNPEEVSAQLKERGCVVALAPVWILEVPDRVGGLAHILNVLVEEGVIVEYMYAFSEKTNDKAQVVMRVRDYSIMEKAMKRLEGN